MRTVTIRNLVDVKRPRHIFLSVLDSEVRNHLILERKYDIVFFEVATLRYGCDDGAEKRAAGPGPSRREEKITGKATEGKAP